MVERDPGLAADVQYIWRNIVQVGKRSVVIKINEKNVSTTTIRVNWPSSSQPAMPDRSIELQIEYGETY